MSSCITARACLAQIFTGRAIAKLRDLTKSDEIDVLACAEPVDPLPDEATLKQRYAAVDKKLNENYQKMIVKAEKEEKETVATLRRFQRQWLKARDAGLKIYLAAFSRAEKERKRLQFLIDVSRTEAEAEA